MKKIILFSFSLLMLCSCKKSFAKEYNLQLIKKDYNARYNGNKLGEKNLVSIEKYNFIFDEEGYIKYYKKTDIYNEKEELIDIEYTCTKINDNERKLDYKIYDTEEEKYYYYSRTYLFNENSWLFKKSSNYTVKSIYNNNEITKFNNDRMDKKISLQDNQVVINIGTNDNLLKLKQGYFYEYEDPSLSKLDDEFSQYDAFGTIEKKKNKYIINYHYDEMSYICEIKTDYNFKSWKAATFNLLFITPSMMVIPYTLGFGNGFEFQDGVDYSGN